MGWVCAAGIAVVCFLIPVLLVECAGLSLTTGGGTRAIPLVPGLEEDVALLCIHYKVGK
jgi:hypothetical protein